MERQAESLIEFIRDCLEEQGKEPRTTKIVFTVEEIQQMIIDKIKNLGLTPVGEVTFDTDVEVKFADCGGADDYVVDVKGAMIRVKEIQL